VRRIYWTWRAQSDLANVRSYIAHDSPRYAAIVVGRILNAVENAATYPEAGRIVPEFERQDIRETINRPYRIVYRLVGESDLHILTIHHSSRQFPESL
jgi:plasmid stabilization system protein ParE